MAKIVKVHDPSETSRLISFEAGARPTRVFGVPRPPAPSRSDTNHTSVEEMEECGEELEDVGLVAQTQASIDDHIDRRMARDRMDKALRLLKKES